MKKKLINGKGLLVSIRLKKSLLTILLVVAVNILFTPLSNKLYANVDFTDQQKVQITGTVTDEAGESMPGVTVIVKGTSQGTITDLRGNYEIAALPQNALIFSFVGMKSQEVTVGSKSVINVKLEVDAVGIEEVVAIGYGAKSKASLTGAVDVVKSEQFESKPQTNVVNSLQGAVSGLLVTRGSGQVGREDTRIQLRGVTSRSDPGVLIVIDGIPQRSASASALNNMNPADIESVTVLKDAQASIYGARAAGGVILITTKRGKSGKPTIKYSGNYSWNIPGNILEKTNVIQHVDMFSEAWENDGINNHFFSYLKPFVENADLSKPTIADGPFGDTPNIWLGHNDWMKSMWETAFMQTHNLSISGQSDKSNYLTSFGVLDQGSMLKWGDNSNKRYFLRLKYEFDVLDNLKLSTNVSLERQKITEPSRYGTMLGAMGSAWTSMPELTDGGNFYNFGGFTAPNGWAALGGEQEELQYRTHSQFKVVYTPVKNLTVNGQYSTNLDINDASSIDKVFYFHLLDDTRGNKSGASNSAGSAYERFTHNVANFFVDYQLDVNEHKLSAMVGASHEELDARGFNAWRNKLITEELNVMTTGDADEQYNDEFRYDWALQSVFSRVTYSFKNKYLLEGIIRYDGSSKFADGKRWGAFPGVSGGWVMSNESFLSGINNVLDYLKMRGSWGQLGNQANVGLYDHYAQIGIGGQYPMGNPDSPSKTQSAWLRGMTSENRSWETVDVKNIGIDFSTLDSRLSGNFDYFVKNTHDLLVNQEFPTVLGVTPPTVNGGKLKTWGWELGLNWSDKIKDFKYFVKVNLSDDKNEVISLEDSKIPGYGFNSFVEGYSAGSYFTFEYDGFVQNEDQLAEYKTIEGVPGNLRVGDAMYRDLDGDGKIEYTLYKEGDPDSGDMTYVGNNSIRWQYSTNLGFSWKGIDFSAFLQGVGKWQVLNGIQPMGSAWWVQPWKFQYQQTYSDVRTDALYPKLTVDGTISGWNYMNSDAPYKLYNNRYLRVKNIQLGYTLPSELTRRYSIDKMRIYFSGNDLFEFSNLPKGFDPERPFAVSYTPFTRFISFGVDLTI